MAVACVCGNAACASLWVAVVATAELFRAMGYYVRDVAGPGQSGIDVLAYRDPLGAKAPHLRAQVRHREARVAIDPMRALESMLRKASTCMMAVPRYSAPSGPSLRRNWHGSRKWRVKAGSGVPVRWARDHGIG